MSEFLLPKRDIYQRARLFDPRSFTHHGKANLNLLESVISRFSDPGQILLDPMAGTGSIYVGLLTGRQVVAGDVEGQWVSLLRENRMCLSRQSMFALATPGLAAQWDAARLPLCESSIDLVITSPPYFDTFSDWDANPGHLRPRVVERGQLGEYNLAYGFHPRQIANLHVYEEYLRAMCPVYAEAWRVLRSPSLGGRPGGMLVLILKDVIRGGRTIPVVQDNLTLALAVGFRLIERWDLPVRGTHFRNVLRVRGITGPETEAVLVLEKVARRTKRRLALVELPKAEDGPGQVIARKAMVHAGSRGYEVWTRSLDESGFRPSRDESGFRLPVVTTWLLPVVTTWLLPGGESQFCATLGVLALGLGKARDRREFAFSLARELVTNAGLGAGDEVAFYGSDERFGRYLCRRLETLGCLVTEPLLGLNNGQRLRWLTNQNKPCEWLVSA